MTITDAVNFAVKCVLDEDGIPYNMRAEIIVILRQLEEQSIGGEKDDV